MKVLVAYETGHGSTVEVAEEIGRTMEEAGATVDVSRCRDVEDASGYDAYVIGSPIWGGRWLGPARAFVKNNAAILSEHPVAIFMTSAAAVDGEGRQMVARRWLPGILEEIPGEPVAVGNFGGLLDFSNYKIAMRLVMKAICAITGSPTSGVHDYRDMEAIRRWAEEVHDVFQERIQQ